MAMTTLGHISSSLISSLTLTSMIQALNLKVVGRDDSFNLIFKESPEVAR
ncbi:hypothetical protein AtNW77_Chr3g0198101 [Arabidopsis thaliana]